MPRRRRRAKPPLAGFGLLVLLAAALAVPFVVGSGGCGQMGAGATRSEPMELGGSWQGMRLTPSESGSARALGVPPGVAGVVVSEVLTSGPSPAAQGGMARGDVIVAVDGKPVANLAELYTLSLSHDATRAAMLSVLRGGQPVSVTLPPLFAPMPAQMPGYPAPQGMAAAPQGTWAQPPMAAQPGLPMQPPNNTVPVGAAPPVGLPGFMPR